MSAYYNEFDLYAAEWLRNLIKAGHIAPGDVDSRSIADVRADDLVGYTQCHFFAGIGVWSHALRLAGWPDDRPVWTGSCPCQPFSAAGKQSGMSDERHLWPVWFKLIRQRQPDVVFGEQVESAIRHGWLDLVQADMEGIGYAFAPVGIPAAGFGAPHIRQRLWFVADAGSDRSERGRVRVGSDAAGSGRSEGLGGEYRGDAEEHGIACELADNHEAGFCAVAGAGLHHAECDAEPCGGAGLMGDTERTRLEGLAGHGDGDSRQVEAGSVAAAGAVERPGPTNGHWRDADWIFCRDGKWRPVESGTFPLAHGVAARMVYACAVCKIETVTYEGVRIVRSFPPGYEGSGKAALLLNEMLRDVSHESTNHSDGWSVSGAEHVSSEGVREMRSDRQAPASPSCGRESNQQCAGEHPDSLPEVPRSNASKAASPVKLPGVRKSVRSQEPSLESESVFCPLCEGIRPHLRRKEVGPPRVGRLRGYGNAIAAQVAAEVIGAYLDLST